MPSVLPPGPRRHVAADSAAWLKQALAFVGLTPPAGVDVLMVAAAAVTPNNDHPDRTPAATHSKQLGVNP